MNWRDHSRLDKEILYILYSSGISLINLTLFMSKAKLLQKKQKLPIKTSGLYAHDMTVNCNK